MKDFFSPIVGGQNDGLTFKSFCQSWQRIFPFLFLLGFNILIFAYKNTFENPWYLVSQGFLVSVFGIWVWKTLQHWNDLKNGRTR